MVFDTPVMACQLVDEFSGEISVQSPTKFSMSFSPKIPGKNMVEGAFGIDLIHVDVQDNSCFFGSHLLPPTSRKAVRERPAWSFIKQSLGDVTGGQ